MAIPALRVFGLLSTIDSSSQFLKDNSDRSRGRSRLIEVEYRDGESDLQALLLSLQSNDVTGVLYYLYLFGEFIRIDCTFLSYTTPECYRWQTRSLR